MLKIIADPSYMSIAVGETITYRVESTDSAFQLDDDDQFEWGSGEVTAFRDLGNGIAVGGPWDGPVAGNREHQYSFSREGKYWIVAKLMPKTFDLRPGFNKDLLNGIEYFQVVAPTGSFMWDPANQERSHSPDPYAALKGITRYYNYLVAAGATIILTDFSPQGLALADRHKAQLAEYERLASALGDRLESTQDWIRIPITATHAPAGSSETAELRVFFAHPKNDGIVKHWKIVDWTHPGEMELDREYEGKGVTNADAIKAAVRDWGLENQYAEGQVTFKVPKHVFADESSHGTLLCSGRSWTGSVADFLERAATVLGILTLVLAVIPGAQPLAGLTFVLSGALGLTGAALNMYDRHAHGVNSDTADALDLLNMAASLMGLAGRWVRCATLAVRMGSGVRTMILFGEVALDGLQGVLVVVESGGEIEQTLNSTTMTPDEKIKKLIQTGASLAVRAALVYVSVKGTMGDISRMNTPRLPPPKKAPAGANGEKLDGPPSENLKKLKDPAKKIDLTDDPTITGNTKNGPHTTTVHADPPTMPAGRVNMEAHFPKNDQFWIERTFSDTEIRMRHRFHKAPNDRSADPYFYAHISSEGSIHVDMVKTMNWVTKTGELVTSNVEGARLWADGLADPVYSEYFNFGQYLDEAPCLEAKALYKMMFDHFEAAAERGGTPIKGIDGQFAWSNYRAYKDAVKNGMEPSRAILEGSKTGKYWKEQLESRGYEYKMAPGFPKDVPGAESVFWEFEVKKK
jgi:hypothetical protein